MTSLIVVVAALLLVGSVLAMSEAAISRMTRVRAIRLVEEKRRNAVLLERIEQDPPKYLNAVYLAVMFIQNGSAILVALIMERLFGGIWVTIGSLIFTLVYFVLVEAMSKTFGILHNDSASLFVAPIVVFFARIFSLPTRLLIWLANVLLPGKGLREGPFVSEEDIRSMAEVGHEEGSIEDEEREMIHSIFELGDTVVREVMVPRPDMIVFEKQLGLRAAVEQCLQHGYSRVPVYDAEPDNICGIVYAKDLFRALVRGNNNATAGDLSRDAHFVPESKKVGDLLREMQERKVHMAIVSDEFGDVAGLVTLEDLIEEIVGEIADEYDADETDIVPLNESTWRVRARVPISELNDELEADLPDEDADTVGGLMAAALGKVPTQGDTAQIDGLVLVAERVQGRRIQTVVVSRAAGTDA